MPENTKQSKQNVAIIVISLIAVLFLAAMIIGVIVLSGKDAETTGRVRDIFIIILALESLLIGAALIILVIQLAILTNLFKNEIGSILASSRETINEVRGTSQFLAKHAVAPVISMTSTFAGFRKLLEIIGFIKRK
jgi:uncharacterized membrane protein YozB (DUF420 family)